MFSSDCVCRFLPFDGLQIEAVPQFAGHFCAAPDQTAGAGSQSFIQFFAAAVFDRTGDVFHTDFKTEVKTAIGGDGL